MCASTPKRSPRDRHTHARRVDLARRARAMNSETREWATNTSPSWCATHANRVVALVLALAAFGVGYYLYEHADGELHLGARDALGPTRTQSWYSSFPEAFDLRGDALIDAVATVKRELPERDCVVVVKRGAVVHEEYYNGATVNSAFDSAEVGKIAVALTIGAAVHNKEFKLDDKVADILAQSGRTQSAPEGWDAEHWRALTVRHLLAQVSGDGQDVPGTAFANDASVNNAKHSPLFVLNAVLRAATGEAPAKWARKHLTEPMGLPNFFAHDDTTDSDISVVGGQMASCRDLARFGQLVVNGGRWRSSAHKTHRLVSKRFISEMLTPSFPEVTTTFGYGGWVFDPKMPVRDTERAGLGVTKVSGLGEDCPVAAGPVTRGSEPRYHVLFNSGGLGKMMITIPSHRVVVVSIGSTWAASPSCPAVTSAQEQAKLAAEERSPLPRNDLFAVQRFWKIMKPAIETKAVKVKVGAIDRQSSYGSFWASLHHKTERARLGDDPGAYNNNMEALVNSVPADQIAQSEAITHANDAPVSWKEGDTKLYSGTCSCKCAPNLEIGQCFNVRKSLSNSCEDLGLAKHGARFCPALGVMNGCSKPSAMSIGAYGTSQKFSSDEMSDMMEGSTIFLINKQVNPTLMSAADIDAKIFSCKVTKSCDEKEHWENEVSTLQCAPTGFSMCTFVEDALCDTESVKMPLTNVSVVQGSNEALIEMPTEGWVLQSDGRTVEGGDLGKDIVYSRLRVTSGHFEHVHLLKGQERSLLAFNSFVGLAVVLVGFAIVRKVKSQSADGEGEEGEGLVKSSTGQYGTDRV
jgi:CubicO group peptidase (beta-lactamase class C family)